MKKLVLALFFISATLLVKSQNKIHQITSDQAIAVNQFADFDSIIYSYDLSCRPTKTTWYRRNPGNNIMTLKQVEEYKNYDSLNRHTYYSLVTYDITTGLTQFGNLFYYKYVADKKERDTVFILDNTGANWLLYGVNRWFYTGNRLDSIHRYNADYPPTFAPELNYRTISTSFNSNQKVTSNIAYYNPNIGVSAPVWGFSSIDTMAYGLNDSLIYFENFLYYNGGFNPLYKYIYTQNDSARYDSIFYYNWSQSQSQYKLFSSTYNYFGNQTLLDSSNFIKYDISQPGTVIDDNYKFYNTYNSNNEITYQLTKLFFTGSFIDYTKQYYSYFNCASVGINDLNSSNTPTFSIYPNPSIGNSPINISAQTPISNLTVYNTFGAVEISVKSSSKNILLDTHKLNKGVYFVEIELENMRQVERLVVTD
ncbi:MAG: T9SS type A sorting domain-containing protein [Bacteroidetes bacterium]|nr:T9SS type A sorting domain-containing protein [Bacteroidota bacterium]